MEREKMVKICWKAYMEVDFKTELLANPLKCMLVSINFETETAILEPFPNSYIEEEQFPTSIKFIELPMPKLKISK